MRNNKKHILIYGLGAVGSALSYFLYKKNNNLYLTGLSKFEKSVLEKGLYIIFNFRLKQPLNQKIDFIINSSFYSKKIEFDIFPENVEFDLILCSIKANGIKNFFQFLVENNIKYKCILFIQNGIGWEKPFKEAHIEFYRAIILFNATRNYLTINNNQIPVAYINTNGPIIMEKCFINKFESIFNLVNSGKKIIEVEKILPYVFRKLWLNTTNGFLSIFDSTLKSMFFEPDLLEIIFTGLLEVKNLYLKANIETLPLPALDPDQLVDKIDFVLNNSVDIYEDKFIQSLPDKENSTLQSLKALKETEYKYIGGEIIKIAEKFNFEMPVNFLTSKIIEEFERNKYFKKFSITQFKELMKKY